MADIRLTAGDDVYVQPEADKNVWNTVFGLDGNDTIRMYQGTATGGKGNDRFERLLDPSNPQRSLNVAYWSAGDNLRVNLVEGWAEDGEGGRDTLIGIDTIHGSGAKNAWVLGDAKDNFYYPNSGTDTFIGGAGNDGIDTYHSFFVPAPGQPGRRITFGELAITVSVDGRQATLSPAVGSGFSFVVEDVEYFNALVAAPGTAEGPVTRFFFADFISQRTMAEQAIAAGGDLRWNAAAPLGTPTTVTFSFTAAAPAAGPGASGFRAFTLAEQQAVRDILAKTSLLAGISFVEVAESGAAVGEMRFGVSQQAASKGVAWMPNQPGAGALAGDVWMDSESMVGLAPGTEGYQALLHEIGHALGLRHPRNVDAGDAWATQLRPQDDRQTLTVMSQVGSADGLFRSEWGVLDVLALRYLYGTRTQGSGDTVWALGERQGGAETTVVDDGGNDTLDASALSTGVRLDLKPGALSSVGTTADGRFGVDNLGITLGSVIEHAIGSASDDVLMGNDGANTLTGGPGNDWIEGGAGVDTAAFAGPRSAYEVSNDFGKVFVKARDGVSGFDTLIGIEQLRFADQTVLLSTKVLAGDVRGVLEEDSRLSLRLPDPDDVPRASVTYRLVGSAAQPNPNYSAHGSATLSSDGQLSYLPNANHWGADSLSFEVSGPTGSNRYMVFLDVLPVNDAAPVARNVTVLGTPTTVLQSHLPRASDADGDAVSYRLEADASKGNVTVSPDGAFSYVPRLALPGADSFRFAVTDNMGGSNVYTASVDLKMADATTLGTPAADVLTALPGNDAYFAHAGNDRISGGHGDDLIDGGLGIDTSVYQSIRVLYQARKTDFGWTVAATAGSEGVDRLVHVERLQFSDMSLALDLDGNAGAVAQIIRAVFGPAFLSNKAFVGIGLQLFDGGMSYADVVKLAVGTDLFAQLAGGRDSGAFVNLVYRNVVGVAPGTADLAHFKGLLDTGVYTQDSLALLACQVGVNTESLDLMGLASAGIEFLPQG
jgi:serralysin